MILARDDFDIFSGDVGVDVVVKYISSSVDAETGEKEEIATEVGTVAVVSTSTTQDLQLFPNFVGHEALSFFLKLDVDLKRGDKITHDEKDYTILDSKKISGLQKVLGVNLV